MVGDPAKSSSQVLSTSSIPGQAQLPDFNDESLIRARLVAAVPHSIFVIDGEGNLQFCNPVAQLTFGCEAGERFDWPFPAGFKCYPQAVRRLSERLKLGESFQNVRVVVERP